MFWSKLFIPTLREPPASVEDPGTRLLIRAGYRRNGVDLYLAQRSRRRVVAMLRDALEAMGGQEMWSEIPSLEDAASGAVRSYKLLPQIWFQFRGSDSLQVFAIERGDDGGLQRQVEELFSSVLSRCGVPFASAVGPSNGRQFVSYSPVGLKRVACCEEAGYAAVIEAAHAMPKPPLTADPEGDLTPERFSTPNQKTIAELVEFTGLPATSQIKSLVQVCGDRPYLVLVRGDHQLERAKMLAAFKNDSRPATAEEIVAWFGAAPGSLGPIGVTRMPILADLCLQGRRNMICGANEDDYHLRHVTPGEDFEAQFMDLRRVEEGDMCPTFPAPIEIRTAHFLAMTTHLIAAWTVTDESSREVAPAVTTAVLMIGEVLRVAGEWNQDADGLRLAPALAPFDVIITPANFADQAQQQAALSTYEQCHHAGLAVLLDDRDERPGVKFKDADLIGIPARITIGKKLAQGLVEVVRRHPRAVQDVELGQAVAALRG